MTIITIATSKGGAGKTTLAQLLIGAIAGRGFRVAVIDADYNHSLADWVGIFKRYPVEVATELNETRIIPLAADLNERNDLLVIDTAGAAMQATVFAIGCADLVLIPCQLSSADVVEAAKTQRLIASAAAMSRRLNAEYVSRSRSISGAVSSVIRICVSVGENKLRSLQLTT